MGAWWTRTTCNTGNGRFAREEKAITVASVSPLAYVEEDEISEGRARGNVYRPGLHLARPSGELVRPAEVTPRPAHRRGLTPRDVLVLRFLAEGWTTADIAHELVYAESTIKKEVHIIVHRLGARNRTQAVAMAIRDAII
ncbi:MAG: LuxR C-terminal-related transcriptional regulator [Actinomycetota bacterium]|nr:LuxR C-terminal-related transcriptional regulator [Actinomycetota bacterium]